MADNVEIQGLEFEIEGQTTQANKGIDSLVNSLSKLKSALKGASGLNKMTDTLGEISQSINGTQSDKLTSLSGALSGLGNVKISATVPKRLTEIGAALNGITWSGVERVEALSGALQGMSGVQMPNLATQGGTTSPTTPAVDAGGGLDSATQDVESTTQAVTRATSAVSTLKSVLGSLGGVFSKTFSAVGRTALNGLKSALTGIGNAAKSAANAGKNMISSFGSKMSGALKGTNSRLGQLFSSLKRIAMYRAIRFFFSQLTKAMKEGINNLYQYSSLMGGQFKGSMDSLATSFQYLKNSMGAMVSPLINAIAPAVDFLIDKFVTLLNVVNQFFARLSGASSFTKAKKAAASYGDSLGNAAGAAKKAAKEIKDATTGIDELNIISQNDDSSNGGGGGGGGNYGDMFETVPIDSAISDFADKLKAAFEAGNWKELGTLLGEKVNEIVNSVDWYGVGQKIGYYLNGAIQTAYWFLKTVDFVNIGSKIAELINGALSEIDGEFIGRLISRWFTIVPDMIIGFIKTLNWKQVGKTVGDALKGAFNEMQEWIASVDWSQLAHDLYKALKDTLTGLDFAGIAQSFFKLLGSALAAAVSFVATFVKDIWNDITGYFQKYLTNDDGTKKCGIDWVKGILQGIWEGIKGIGRWIKDNVFQPFIDGFKSVFGIHSPSTVMAEQGHYIVAGLWKGIKDKISSGIDVIKGWAGSVVEWFTKGKDGKGIVENFKELAGNIVSGFKDKVSNTYNNVKSSVTTWASKVKDWFTSSSFGGVNMSNFATFANNTIEGFKTKISSAYTNVKTSITTWASKAKDWFTSASFGGVNFNTFSTFANNTIEGFKTKIGSAYTNVKSNITTWASGVKEWFTSSSFGGVNNTNWQTFANNTIEGFKTKIGNAYTNTKSNIMTWASNVKAWFTENGYGGVNNTNWQTFANNVIEGFKTKIGNAYTNTKANITTWASSVKTWFSDIASNSAFAGFATNVIDGFKTRVGNYYTTAKTNITTWATSIGNWFKEKCSSSTFYQVASDVVEGFKNGIGALYTTCKNTITSWGSSIIDWFKGVLGINSPSKVFYDMGGFSVAGFNNAITQTGKSTKKVVGAWADSFTSLKPTMAMAVDTSALKHYDSAAYARFISANVQSRTEISSDGFLYAMETFYHEYMEPTMSQMAGDMRRQADKKETTEVHVGNRVITDAVETQRQANGFRFVTT